MSRVSSMERQMTSSVTWSSSSASASASTATTSISTSVSPSQSQGLAGFSGRVVRVIHEGQLRKLSRKAFMGVTSLWQTRWFVLRPGAGHGEHAYLSYHKDPRRAHLEEGKCIRLASVTSVRLSGSNRARIELVSEQRSSKDESRIYMLEANSQSDAEVWLDKILDTDRLRWDASQEQRKKHMSKGLIPAAFRFSNGGVVRLDCSSEWDATLIITRCLEKARQLKLVAAAAAGDADAVAKVRAVRWRETFKSDLKTLLGSASNASVLSPQGATAEADFMHAARPYRLSRHIAALGWRALRDVELVAMCRFCSEDSADVPVPFHPNDRCMYVMQHLMKLFDKKRRLSSASVTSEGGTVHGVKLTAMGASREVCWLQVTKESGIGSHLGDYILVHDAVRQGIRICLELSDSEVDLGESGGGDDNVTVEGAPELFLDIVAQKKAAPRDDGRRVPMYCSNEAVGGPEDGEGSSKTAAWHEWTCASLWDYSDMPFRAAVGEGFQVTSAENHDGARLYVEVGLYFGGEPLAGITADGVCTAQTRIVPASQYPSWNEWLDFDIVLANLPRETELRACIYAIQATAAAGGDRTPTDYRSPTTVSTKGGTAPAVLGKASCLLMDFEGLLRQGVNRLALWNEDGDATLGYLFLTLDTYPLQIVFPTAEMKATLHGISAPAPLALDSASSNSGTPAGSRTSTGTDANMLHAAAAAVQSASKILSNEIDGKSDAESGISGETGGIAIGTNGRGNGLHPAGDAADGTHMSPLSQSPTTPPPTPPPGFKSRSATGAAHRTSTTRTSAIGMPGIPVSPEEQLERIIRADPLTIPDRSEQALLWQKKISLRKKPHALPKVLLSVPWHNRFAVVSMHQLLDEWQPLSPTAALELFGERFADACIRDYAVRCLQDMSDEDLAEYILQLVQVIKAEPYHTSAIAHFLLKRALINPAVIGHRLFWNLRAELENSAVRERYGVILRVFLRLCGSYRAELLDQAQAVSEMESVANAIKSIKGADVRLAELRRLLQHVNLKPSFRLPLDPSITVTKLRAQKCKYMDSKKLPLWLVFDKAHANPGDPPHLIIFKSGDDLRQDILTLQMMRIMDRLWRKHDLDLRMNCYGCIATGFEVGMLEVVTNSETTSAISKAAGGAAATFSEKPIADWLRANNDDTDPTVAEAKYRAAVDTFVRSCAGYSVATCVLGIGDRHNDNIMCQRDGHLFHIDFGHILGNFKSKFGIKRETAKFVLTPDFAYVMGGRNSDDFAKYRQYCCEAFLILRREANLFLNLFSLMLNSGMPELTSKEIRYLKKMLLLDVSDAKAREKFNEWITESLDNVMTKLNNYIHSAVH
ncbi:phosphatidylinositol-4,5-bisphosphate 3-kinase catalytic subunit [Pycnococcus provasolii]